MHETLWSVPLLPVVRSALGAASLFQVCFLPGYIIARALGLTQGAVRTLVLSFALSLVANFLLVFALVATGIYTQPVLLVILGIELVLLVRPSFAGKRGPATNWIADGARISSLVRRYAMCSPAQQIGFWLAITCAVIAIGGHTLEWIREAGSIFKVWDEVVSWNRWALEWAANSWPTETMHYPQLLPANLSLPYVFSGPPAMWAFSRFITPIFALATLLVFFDLALDTREIGFVVAIPFASVLLQATTESTEFLGYADVCLAFLVAASLACLVRARAWPDDMQSWLGLGAVFIAGAALTKADAWYLAALYIIAAYARIRRSPSSRGTSITRVVLPILAITLPWYLVSEFLMPGISGSHTMNMYELTQLSHHGREGVARLAFGLWGLLRYGWPWITLVPVALLAGLALPSWRWHVAASLAWFAVWGFWLSYDGRNLTLVVPLMACGAAFGLCHMLPRHPKVLLAATAIIVLLGFGRVFPANRIDEYQARQIKALGEPALNDFLYTCRDQYGFQGKILSNYNFMRFLPGVQDYYAHEYFHDESSIAHRISSGEARYLLYAEPWASPDVRNVLAGEKSAGRLQEVNVIGIWHFLMVVPR